MQVLIEFEPNDVQKIVEYLWRQPYGDVAHLIEIIKAADQKALAKKHVVEAECSTTKS